MSQPSLNFELMRVQDFVQLPQPRLPAALLDRLWPRGISKIALGELPWIKSVTPSTALRRWFHEDREAHWPDFQSRYAQELLLPEAQAGLQALRNLAAAQPDGRLALLSASKELSRCHLPILRQALLAA